MVDNIPETYLIVEHFFLFFIETQVKTSQN